MTQKRKPAGPEASVGDRITEVRQGRGLTQAALARAASIERSTLSKIETGRRRASLTELVRISEVLGLSLEKFLEQRSPDTLATIRSQREAILRACKKHGARRPRLFGSVARGEADSESDIDFLVDMEPGRSLLDQAALLVELRELLGRDVDVVVKEGLRPRIRDQVLNEAVSL